MIVSGPKTKRQPLWTSGEVLPKQLVDILESTVDDDTEDGEEEEDSDEDKCNSSDSDTDSDSD